jgi:hypothetical protein
LGVAEIEELLCEMLRSIVSAKIYYMVIYFFRVTSYRAREVLAIAVLFLLCVRLTEDRIG